MNARISTFALCAALAGFSPTLFAAEATTTQTPTATPQATADQPVKLSAGLDAIVKLSKAGVSDSVILTYVQSTGVMYHPTPKDLIAMSQAGVSEQVTSALMQKGAEIHTAALTSQQQAQATAQATATQAAQQAAAYDAAQNLVSTSESSGSTVVYIGSPGYTWSPNRVYTGYYFPRNYYYPRTYGYYSPRYYSGTGYGGFHNRGYRGGYRYHR